MTVASQADQFETRAPYRCDHIEKYHQLVRIVDELSDETVYAGKKLCVNR